MYSLFLSLCKGWVMTSQEFSGFPQALKPLSRLATEVTFRVRELLNNLDPWETKFCTCAFSHNLFLSIINPL
jgi:hypothetical protein